MFSNYKLFFQSIEDYAIIMIDSRGIIQFSNTAIQDITGYTAEELNHQPISILYTEEDQNKNRDDFDLSYSLQTGKLEMECWRAKKDGSRFWASVSYFPVYDKEKELIGYTSILKDITQKKQKELEMRSSEERFRLMVEAVKDYAIFMLDTKGYITTWNEGAKLIKGYSDQEIIGKHFSTFYTKEDLEANKPQNELKIAIATGKYEEVGWRVRKNGSTFWANVLITPLFNEDNELIGFSKVTRDLSIKREEEEDLRKSEERFRLLVEQVKDYAIFMLDEKGRIISWNEGAKKIKGYDASEVIGKYFSIFYTEEDKINKKPAFELEIAKKEGKYEEERWRVKKDGSLFWANVVITAIYNKEGLLLGFSKVTRDLTERREAEKILQEGHERYKMLANELKLANDELAYANKELEQFTSIASHDLQEPLRTIKSFLQLIDIKLKETEGPELKIYIQKAIAASNRMKELITNLLRYSQLSKNEISVEKINVNELIAEVLQNLKSSIDASKARVTIENEIETIQGDRIQLVQLVQNLVGNALKFTSDKAPEIVIKAIRENGHYLFSVTDNGIGIAEDNLNKVFEIFKRLPTKRDYPGTGIGLAICKRIIDRHNGKIWSESEIGKGTTFYFTLNCEKEQLVSIP